MNCNQTSKSSSMHEYLNRCHLRTLKHFPQMYNDKCFQSDAMGYEEECLDDFGASARKVKTSMQSKFRHSERENYCFPYKKSLKLLKASKRFRRKCHFNTENDDKLHEFVYLNQLADTVITSDSTTGIGGTTNMDKRISKLFDEIQYEIFKAKRKYAKNIANTFKPHTPHVLCVFINLFIIHSIEAHAILLDVLPSLIDLSDFDCVLCYRTLWKPVVTPCGHTYCMVS